MKTPKKKKKKEFRLVKKKVQIATEKEEKRIKLILAGVRRNKKNKSLILAQNERL